MVSDTPIATQQSDVVPEQEVQHDTDKETLDEAMEDPTAESAVEAEQALTTEVEVEELIQEPHDVASTKTMVEFQRSTREIRKPSHYINVTKVLSKNWHLKGSNYCH